MVSRIGMSRARIYVSGTNLLTITNDTGRDPEAPTVPQNGLPMRVGTDGGTYPLPRIFTAGLQIDF